MSNFYKNKKFVKITEKKLPFKDNEFDFVITSHVIEHVDDFQFFISEIERISNKGYIELPTKLGDNLVFENSNDHLWMFEYDDNSNIIYEPEYDFKYIKLDGTIIDYNQYNSNVDFIMCMIGATYHCG